MSGLCSKTRWSLRALNVEKDKVFKLLVLVGSSLGVIGVERDGDLGLRWRGLESSCCEC